VRQEKHAQYTVSLKTVWLSIIYYNEFAMCIICWSWPFNNANLSK